MYNPPKVDPKTILKVVTAAAKKHGFEISGLKLKFYDDERLNKYGALEFEFHCPCGNLIFERIVAEKEYFYYGQDLIVHRTMTELQQHVDGDGKVVNPRQGYSGH